MAESTIYGENVNEKILIFKREFGEKRINLKEFNGKINLLNFIINLVN